MRIHAAKEIGPAVHIQHDPPPRIVPLLPLVEIRSHLDPLRAHIAPRPAPLPPRLPPDPLDPVGAQLRLDSFCAGHQVRLGDRDALDFDPVGAGYPLGGEALDVFDGVVRGVQKEFLDEVQALVVGDVGGGFLGEAFLAIEILEGEIEWLVYCTELY